MVSQKSNIRMRYLRPEDTPKIIEIFEHESAYTFESPRMLALAAHRQSPRSLFQYFLFVLGLAISYHSSAYRYLGFGTSLAALSLYLLYRHFTSEVYLSYIRNAKKGDLVNLAAHYKLVSVGKSDGEEIYEPLGSDAFWIVEEVLPDGRIGEIIGSVALDCAPRDGIVQGELRRMVVSSRHRRMGIGKLLVETLIAHARKHRLPAVWLGTSEYQVPARVMYQKYGWMEVYREQLKQGLVAVDMIWYKLALTYT